MAIVHLTKENFTEEVLQAKGKVLVDFWATWCGPCRMLAPTLESFAESHPEVKVGKVDVDEARDLAMEYRISTIPTLMVFQNGRVLEQSIGVISQEEMAELVR